MKQRLVNGSGHIKDFQITLEDLDLSNCNLNLSGAEFIRRKKQILCLYKRNLNGFNGEKNSMKITTGFYNVQRRYNNLILLAKILLGLEFRKIVHTEKKNDKEQDSLKSEYIINDITWQKVINKMTRREYFG